VTLNDVRFRAKADVGRRAIPIISAASDPLRRPSSLV
jgi:hypothetical protein